MLFTPQVSGVKRPWWAGTEMFVGDSGPPWPPWVSHGLVLHRGEPPPPEGNLYPVLPDGMIAY